MWNFKRQKQTSSAYRAAWERARAQYRQKTRFAARFDRCGICTSLRAAIVDRIDRWRESMIRGYHAARKTINDVTRQIAQVRRKQTESFPDRMRRLWQTWKRRRQTGKRDVNFRFRRRSYAGSRDRRYRVHLPPQYNARSPLPLVMVLHGCRQTHSDIQRISAFDEVADREGFIVVYPFVTSYTGLRNRNCWGWWLHREIHAGAGEVEDIWQILREVQATYRVDKRRIHVAGLSSGAGMAVALMVARSSKIASGAAVAGVPYAETARAVGFVHHIAGHFRPIRELVQEMDSEMGDKKRLVPLFIAHSHDDGTVNIRAARNLRDSWAHCFGVDLNKQVSVRHGATGVTRWEHSRYRGRHRRTQIETLFLEGVGHGWYGGRPGRYSYPQAPHLSEWLWRFFQTHPMGEPLQETMGIEPLSASVPESEEIPV